MFVHAKLRVHKTVIMGATLHCLIYNLLIAFVFPYIFYYQLSVEDMLNTKGLVSLTEYQQMG